MHTNRTQPICWVLNTQAVQHPHAHRTVESTAPPFRAADQSRFESGRAKKYSLLVVFIVMSAALLLPLNAAAEEIWTSIRLPVPERPADRQYLSLAKGDTFSLAQIDAPLIVVQVYSMYCPICQREAPGVNSLFKMLSARKDIAGKTKLLAIGAGNSEFEVDFYRTTYNVLFPLFADGDFKLHQLLGEVGTPYYYILKKDQGGVLRQVYAKSGAFESPERFLDLILERLK